MRLQLSNLVAILSLAVLLIVPASASAQRDDDVLQIPEDAEPARYVENIDGDTIIVELENVQGDYWEHTVRLIGIDTPENSYSYGNESYTRAGFRGYKWPACLS